jgi:steroid delta-isomerase
VGNDQTAHVARLVDFFESITPESTQRIAELYAPDAWFKDPFNEVRGTQAIAQVFEHMFTQVAEPRFRVTDRVCAENGALLTWDFTFRFRPDAPPVTVRGASHLRFDAAGRVAYHCDYWDAAGELYEKLPVLGALMRLLRRRLSATGRTAAR